MGVTIAKKNVYHKEFRVHTVRHLNAKVGSDTKIEREGDGKSREWRILYGFLHESQSGHRPEHFFNTATQNTYR